MMNFDFSNRHVVVTGGTGSHGLTQSPSWLLD